MKIRCNIDGSPRELHVEPWQRLQTILKQEGLIAVRDSDDAEGFAGSDTVLLDGIPVYANLVLAAQVEGKSIRTPHSLAQGRKLSTVQQAMVDAGVVQSGFNSPAAALLITELLERDFDPSDEMITDALSGIFNRATGYKQFYQAVHLAAERMKDEDYTTEIAPEFRDDLRVVGKVRPKIDGRKLVAGWKAYVEDMVQPRHCVLKMLRSPHAHAYITSIDTSQAESIPGVVLIITHLNCPDVYYGQAGQGFPEPSPYDRRMFNQKVRHVGDRVAAVIAETEEIAESAIARITVTYEVLEPVLSIEDAMREGAPVVQGGEVSYESGAPDDLDAYNEKADPRDGRIIYQFPIHADPHRNIAASVSGGIGNVEAGFSQADVIIDREYRSSQIQCTPLETHVVYTRMDGDRLIIHASTQVPWHLRRIVAHACGISENNVRVIKERVGGGYGSKQDILLEDVAAYATHVTGRDVYFRFTREEEFIANSTRHPMRIRVRLGARRDGTLTAVYMQVLANTGPFGNHCLTVPMNACSKSLPLVVCENFSFDVTTYYSNIPPTGAYQGYGAPKGSFAMQMALAELADALGLDQLTLLERIRVREGTMLEILRCLGEGREGTPAMISSCGLGPALRKGAELIAWGEREKSDDPDVLIGKGVVIIQQGSGLPGLDHSCADVHLLSDGTFMVHSGGADLGTGLDTICVKFTAEVLCTDMDRVSILSGDTDNTPFDTGAYASSGTFFSGSAALKAALDLKEKIIEAASRIMGVGTEDLTISYPGVIVSSDGSQMLTYKELAHKVLTGSGQGELAGFASFTTEDSAFPYGAHFCQVGVNIKTGEIEVQKYYAIQDCGTPINPELALGQIYGGTLKSIGHSLYEELVLDRQGRCLTPDLRGYGVPMITELPKTFEAILVETNDPYGPFGGKSVSEVSTNGAAPVIASAIHDAVGVWIRDWPFTPEKILRGLGKF